MRVLQPKSGDVTEWAADIRHWKTIAKAHIRMCNDYVYGKITDQACAAAVLARLGEGRSLLPSECSEQEIRALEILRGRHIVSLRPVCRSEWGPWPDGYIENKEGT